MGLCLSENPQSFLSVHGRRNRGGTLERWTNVEQDPVTISKTPIPAYHQKGVGAASPPGGFCVSGGAQAGRCE